MYLFIEWAVLEEHFNSLCNTLPCNHQLIVNKLKTVPHLSQDGREQLCKLISSSADRKINQTIITYLFVKLCYNGSSTSPGLKKYNVLGRLIGPTDTTTGLQHTCMCLCVCVNI